MSAPIFSARLYRITNTVDFSCRKSVMEFSSATEIDCLYFKNTAQKFFVTEFQISITHCALRIGIEFNLVMRNA
jgi:hypothetical protein